MCIQVLSVVPDKKYDDNFDYSLPSTLEKLRSFCKKITWRTSEDRREFIRRFYQLIVYWEQPLPNLRKFFSSEEIERLLKGSIDHVCGDLNSHEGQRIIEFVVRTGYKDEPKVDETGKPLLRRTTPIHIAARHSSRLNVVVYELFQVYNRYDLNYVDETGMTHFHLACRYGFDDVVQKFIELGQDPNSLEQPTRESPLHLALKFGRIYSLELMLRNGADPNAVDSKGLSALHLICQALNFHNDEKDDVVELFFDTIDETGQAVQLNLQDRLGNTPLHYALQCNNTKAAQCLLLRRADPNIANNEGSTPLHFIGQCYNDNTMAEEFFRITQNRRQVVKINAQDKFGMTPLHLALRYSEGKMVKLLLRKGANPNLANTKGETALHIICQKYQDNGLAEILFKFGNKRHRTIRVDVRDKKGQTPLQLAVANLLPKAVDQLLIHGADLSTFVFPSSTLDPKDFSHSNIFKLTLASRTMCVIQLLQEAGHYLNVTDILTIMDSFAKYGFKIDGNWFKSVAPRTDTAATQNSGETSHQH
uniref:Uncharacterized protein n=1 Tax=Trichogramma kaykai TaxID=54128 RepID=A0ABD2VWA7_9HYME